MAEKGITIELTPQVAESLRQADLKRKAKPGATNEDDWNEILLLPPEPPPSTAKAVEPAVVENSDESENDSVSIAPPETLPVVLVNAERLVGYRPSSYEEASELEQQVHEALMQSPGIDDDNPQQQEAIASHFDERVTKLFAEGIARHADSVCPVESPWVRVEYPEFLCQRDPPTVVNTARLWKRFLRSHPIPVVDRLLRQRLAHCNRSMFWKDAMRTELEELARNEQSAQIRREQQQELYIWKTQRRKEQLDKLYAVREAFEQRVELAQAQVSKLERERDKSVAARLDEETYGLVAFPTEMTDLLALPDDGSDDQSALLSAASDHAEEEDVEFGSVHELPELEHNRDVDPVELAKQAKLHQVREACTSSQLKMAMAVLNSLETKLQQVDDLLDVLQHEEWQDDQANVPEADESMNDLSELSLLDRILAMILGALAEKPVEWLVEEHRSIVQEWKIQFGRLPYSSTELKSTTSQTKMSTRNEIRRLEEQERQALRESLGIEDNLWDKEEEEEQVGLR